MGYLLPDDLHPDTISFCIEVPDDPAYLSAFGVRCGLSPVPIITTTTPTIKRLRSLRYGVIYGLQTTQILGSVNV